MLGTGVYYLTKLARSTLWQTVAASSKVKLADALASGDTSPIVDLTWERTRQHRVPLNEEEQSAMPYRRATSQRE